MYFLNFEDILINVPFFLIVKDSLTNTVNVAGV